MVQLRELGAELPMTTRQSSGSIRLPWNFPRSEIAAVVTAILALAVFFSGACGSFSGGARVNPKPTPLLVNVSTEEIAGPKVGAAEVPLQVIDHRTDSTMQRTHWGIGYLGPIVLQPEETQLVRAVVQGSLQRAVTARDSPAPPPQAECELKDFTVTTPNRPQYGGATAQVEWILRIGAQQRTVTATGEQRNYLYPTAGVVKAALLKALKQASTDTEQAAREMLSATAD